MNQIIANWTKLCVGIAALIVTVGWVTGHVSAQDISGLVGALLAIHAGASGISGIIGGPTQNNALTMDDVNKAVALNKP